MAPTNSDPVPNTPGLLPVQIPQSGTSSLWDRISTWASENKGTVYTIAGLTLVVGAGGAIYYLTDYKNAAPGSATTNKRKSKRDRKKAKEKAETEVTVKDEAKAGV